MLRPSLFLLSLLALMASTGCGLKGPLYLPTTEQVEREAERREELRKRREQREREAEQDSAEAQQRQTF